MSEPEEPKFVFICTDAPGMEQRRLQSRPSHIEYMMAVQDITVFGGPLRDDEDTLSSGSIFCLALPDRQAAQKFMEDEPYNKMGIFESVVIRRYLQMMPQLRENQLEEELELEKTRLTQKSQSEKGPE
jgi:uncharacterized protein YciI